MILNDMQVRRDVETELDTDTRFDARRIGVAVRNGVVTLSGQLGSYSERRAAEQVTQTVAGVRAIANDIVVELPWNARRSDAELAEAALLALQSDALIPAESLRLVVNEGWLTVEGEVATQFQKQAAQAVLGGVEGIKGINNGITIRTGAGVDEVKSRIDDAIRRRAQLDARGIRITLLNGTVTLEGEVRTQEERQEAEQAAWSAPGVLEVVDRLTVHS
jgi:osmotically-inducible protein OsmY